MYHVTMFSLLTLLFCATLAYSLDLKGQIGWNHICPSLESLGPSFASLDNGKYSSPISADGSFVLPAVKTGTYLLTVLTHDFYFDPLRIDIFNDSQSVEVRPFIPGTQFAIPANPKLSYPILLTPKHAHDYFVPPPNFNLLNMLNSPMVLLMIFGAAFMLAMPYLMKSMNMDDLQMPQMPPVEEAQVKETTPQVAQSVPKAKGHKGKRR